MAGDWIKVEKTTARKPEILQLAELLAIHPDQAFGLCVRFWCWCDDQLADGNAPRVTSVTLDCVFGQQGFAESLLKVGWLRVRSGSLEIPNFDRHLSQGSKARALAADRVSQHRRKNRNAPRVTDALPEKEKEKELKDKYKEPPTPTKLGAGPGDEGESSGDGSTKQTRPPKAAPFDPAGATIPANLDTPGFREAWALFCRHRSELPKSKAKPLTPAATETLLKRLATGGAEKAIRDIEHSVSNGWAGVYESDSETKGKNTNGKPSKAPAPASIEYDPNADIQF